MLAKGRGFLVGATIVAVGTSVPELATTLIAKLRGHDEVGLGTVLGSNALRRLRACHPNVYNPKIKVGRSTSRLLKAVFFNVAELLRNSEPLSSEPLSDEWPSFS